MSESVMVLDPAEAAWQGVSAAFAALGQVFICLDDQFKIVHASSSLDGLLGRGSAHFVEHMAIEDLLGRDLFGTNAVMRKAIEAGERRERCDGQLRLGRKVHPVSVSVAPAPPELLVACRQDVKSVVVLAPAIHATAPFAQPSGESAGGESVGVRAAGAAIREPEMPADASQMPQDEVTRLKEALATHRWRRNDTARALHISRSTLWRKMREAGLI